MSSSLAPQGMASVILWCGVAFLAFALIVALWSAYEALKVMRAEAKAKLAEAEAKRRAMLRASSSDKESGEEPDGIRNVIGPADLPTLAEALGELIAALAKAPAWYAMFIGGYLLLSLSAGMCKPECAKSGEAAPASTQSVQARPTGQARTITTTTTTITRIEARRTVPPAPSPNPSPSPSPTPSPVPSN